jgi:putative hydroxymethylpyrimidine transport system substrate-binding protein
MVRPSLRTPAVGPDGLLAALSSGAVPHPKRLLACAVALALALVLGACGQSGSARPDAAATLELDFQPNAVHAGIYTALARDYTGAEGVDLSVRAPGASTDSVKLLTTGRAQFAILDIHDLALARQRGRDVVGVMALVQRPLSAVLADPGVGRPRDLAGRRVGVSGRRSDAAILAAIVRHDGGAVRRIRETRVRAALPALLAGRVAASVGFWSSDGAELLARRPDAHVFRADDYGAPAYPELVLCVTRETLQDRRAVVRATVAALRRGYTEALNDPESAVGAVVDRTPGLDRAAVQAAFDAVSPAFVEGVTRFGELDPARLRVWARWEARERIVRRPPDVALAFAPGF